MYFKKDKEYIFLTKGFTLLELMIAMIILGILASLVSGNFLSSLKKGRDARRKADLQEIQKALELYYENNRRYPDDLNFGKKLVDPSGKVYMQKVPTDPSSNCSYIYLTGRNGGYYYLLSTIENPHDNSYGVSQNGYEDPETGDPIMCDDCLCRFYVSSPNAIPLAPVPTP